MSRGDLRLPGRVALVTGAARGLGRAEALALASRGARVVAVDILDPSATVDAIRRDGGEAAGLTEDLAPAGSAEKVVDGVLDRFGDLDILVNNAGLVRDRMSFNISDDDWELVLAVNLSASFYLARAAVRHWRRQAEDGRTRVIVNTASESGLLGNAGQANYAAAKAGIAALTLTLAAELGRYGIRVNAIAPRARTPMSLAAFGDLPTSPEFDPFAPEHVAAVVAWLSSDAASDVSGQVLVVHGGGIQVMRTWSAQRTVSRQRKWEDAELLKLREELFPHGGTWYMSPAIGDLFMSSAAEKG